MVNNNLRYFVIFVFVILSLYFVLAALTNVTLVTPAAGGIVNGTYTFNATITGSADDITFYHNQSGTWTQFCINITSGVGPFTCVNDTANLLDGTYYFNATAKNDTTTVSDISADVIVDNNNPALSYISPTEADSASKSQTWIFVNVSASDTNNDSITFNLYHSNGTSINSTSYSDSYATKTINWTGLSEGAYIYNITANDSATNSNSTSSRTITLDTTAPSVSLTESSSGQTSLRLTISGGGTCTADRSGATISGSTLTETGLDCGKSHTYTVTCTDAAGNAGSSSATSFITDGCGGKTTIPQSKQKTHSWSKITPGVTAIMKDFDEDMGVKQIQIEVNNEAQSVKITVTKYNDKPAAVTISKTGKVYKYLQIEATNLADELGKATVTLQIGKSWLSSNGLDADNVALFRFGESAGQWNELVTTHVGSEGDNELYDVELTSFSFFAISEKSAAVAEGAVAEGGEAAPPSRNLVWLWVLIAILVLVIIGWGMKKKKTR